MVSQVHHHHGESGCIGPCDCPNPGAPEPCWARQDRPPPTSYRDEPGPLVHIRPQHVGPLAVTGAVGCAAGVAASLLLPPAVTVVVLVALLVGAAVVARIPDEAPRVRVLRR